jgi:hypothetical protein
MERHSSGCATYQDLASGWLIASLFARDCIQRQRLVGSQPFARTLRLDWKLQMEN